MRICIVQSKASKGKVDRNIENHVRLIDMALESEPDLIVFPELSITGYEPMLAGKLACDIADDRFACFQKRADVHGVSIAIGVPTKAPDGINISLLFFRPAEKRLHYSKQRLHEDELPYFVCGKGETFLNIAGKKIAFGICYESLQRAHIAKAVAHNADLYIASVAKPERGVKKAYAHFPSMAKAFGLPIAMSNAVGPCDDFIGAGQSAAWNADGALVVQLDALNEGILIFDTERDEGSFWEYV